MNPPKLNLSKAHAVQSPVIHGQSATKGTVSNDRQLTGSIAVGEPPALPLRVLYYSHTADVSGAEISLLLTISHMPKADSILVAPLGELLKRAERQGIHCRAVSSFRARMTSNPVGLLRGIVGTVAAGLELRRVVGEVKPDVIHANSIRAGLIATVAAVGKEKTCQVVWHVRDNLAENLPGRVIRRVAGWRVNAVFAISTAIQENFATTAKLRRKTVVAHNGIDVSQPTGVSLRGEFGVPEAAFVIAAVGQIAPWKRQMDAVVSFSEFHRQVPRSELWIVGEPKFRRENVEYERQLREAVTTSGLSNNVRFLGFREDVMNVMNSADVLLVTSDNEPFGRVIIEAMLASKPVIGTRGGGVPEIIEHERTGILVNTGDTTAMTRALARLHEDRRWARELGRSGRDRVLHRFSIQSTTECIYRVYLQHVFAKGREYLHEAVYRFGGQ